MGEENIFGIIDYCLFAGLLIISGGIGLYFSYIGSKSPEEYLMGNRSLKPLPVAMSLLTTYVSATSILGVSGEVYANGMQLWSLALGGPVGILFASYFVLPVLYPLRLTSINEYIELRFKSKKLRLAIFLALLTNVMIMSGLSLYAPTLAISSITKLNSLTNILLLGIICTIYSSFGGIKAVIWTDVFQLIVMVIGLITIVAIGIAQNGGFIEVLHTASQRGRLEIFDMSLSPFVKYTFVNSFLFGFFAQLRKHIMEQSCIQRLCSVQSIDKSRSVLNLHIAGKCIIYFLIFTGGLVCYVTYAGCDPMTMGIIKKKEQILSYFVMNKLNIFPGIPGLFVATLMAGSL
ncbi:Sodium-coupled monocarboxylate transporter 2, partial [Armadillidium vulgare]